MQLAWSRIWTRVAVSISYDDNHYTTGTSNKGLIYINISCGIIVRYHFAAVKQFLRLQRQFFFSGFPEHFHDIFHFYTFKTLMNNGDLISLQYRKLSPQFQARIFEFSNPDNCFLAFSKGQSQTE